MLTTLDQEQEQLVLTHQPIHQDMDTNFQLQVQPHHFQSPDDLQDHLGPNHLFLLSADSSLSRNKQRQEMLH